VSHSYGCFLDLERLSNKPLGLDEIAFTVLGYSKTAPGGEIVSLNISLISQHIILPFDLL
jgi:hypothetical protein